MELDGAPFVDRGFRKFGLGRGGGLVDLGNGLNLCGILSEGICNVLGLRNIGIFFCDSGFGGRLDGIFFVVDIIGLDKSSVGLGSIWAGLG